MHQPKDGGRGSAQRSTRSNNTLTADPTPQTADSTKAHARPAGLRDPQEWPHQRLITQTSGGCAASRVTETKRNLAQQDTHLEAGRALTVCTPHHGASSEIGRRDAQIQAVPKPAPTQVASFWTMTSGNWPLTSLGRPHSQGC